MQQNGDGWCQHESGRLWIALRIVDILIIWAEYPQTLSSGSAEAQRSLHHFHITPPKEHSQRTKLNRKNSGFPSDCASTNNKQLNGKLTTPGCEIAEEEGPEERIRYDISRLRMRQRRVLTRNGHGRSGIFPFAAIECRPLGILDVAYK